MSNVPDINVILAQMAEMQKQLNEGRMFADLHLKSMTGRLGLLEPSCDDNPH